MTGPTVDQVLADIARAQTWCTRLHQQVLALDLPAPRQVEAMQALESATSYLARAERAVQGR